MKTVDFIETFIFKKHMKIITKIVGYIGLSVALLRMPHGQAVTLEQVKTYIAGCRQESIQNLKALLEQEKKRSATTEYIQEFLEDYRNKQDAYCDENGNFVIETVNLNSPSPELLYPFLTYKKQKWEDWNNKQKVNPLDAISEELSADILKQRSVDVNELKGKEELSADTLKQRGVDVNELKEKEKEKGKGINKVYEITFDSILKSPFFTEQQREQGRMWSQDLKDLKAAVADYVKTCVPLYRKDGKIKIIQRDIQIDTNNKKCIQSPDIDRFTDISICLPVPKNEAVAVKQKIQLYLKKMLDFKNGKEKVILFLLLDNATSPEFRCKWVWDDRKGVLGGFFNEENNAFLFNPDDIEWSLSHEIGHYLQMHLGLKQTYNDYQNSFAQKLLLLENNLPDDAIFGIPKEISNKVSTFDASPCSKLSAKACFEYFQLIARWKSWKEISNILGCYFKSDTLYVHALSDIRELECIRYGHNTKIKTEAIITKCCTLLKDDNIKQTFTSTCNEAFGKHAPTEALKLLCRLHGRNAEDAENVVCDFDYDVQEWAKEVKPALKPALMDRTTVTYSKIAQKPKRIGADGH